VKKKPINPLILVAAALGFGAAYLGYSTITKQKAEMEATIKRIEEEAKKKGAAPVVVQKAETRSVVYSKLPIQANTVVKEELIQVKDVPLDLIPPGAFFDKAEVIGKYAARCVEAGELLTNTKIKPKDQIGGMSFRLSPGMRAIPLSVASPEQASGFLINDGDFVDLLLTDGSGTRTIVQNVKVLAFFASDRPTDQTDGIRRPAGNVAVFEVTPQQAEALVQVATMGSIRMVLRGIKDKQVARTKGISSDDIRDNPKVIQRITDQSMQAVQEEQLRLQQEQKQEEAGDAGNQ
jgi:Flp pilus assembly protein CpaB